MSWGLKRPLRGACAILVLLALLPSPLLAQAQIPAAPDSVSHNSPLAIDWGRFDRLAEVARSTDAADRLPDVARSLKASVPAEAGRLSAVDWYCLGAAWWAYHYPPGRGRPLYRDTSSMGGEELYSLLRKGYRIDGEQAARIQADLLSLLGVPSELMTGLVRGRGIDRGAWVLSQVGTTWLRSDAARCLPPAAGEWRPSPAFFQVSADLDGVLAFLKAHLPDGEMTARQQGLKRPLSLPDWEAWGRSEARLRDAARTAGADLLYASTVGLFTPSPIGDGNPDVNIAPPTSEALNALEQLRRKPIKPTRGVYLAATARKYVGLPYVWGGENPSSGFDCSGLVKYVCRTWGISVPRTAAEQYHMGRQVSFMDLEPGDLVFLANTYKPGVSHVGIYIGDGQWVQAAGSGIGVIIGDVPYWDAGSGPGARRLDLARLPRVAGEQAPPRSPNRAAVVASRHATRARSAPSRPGSMVIVSVKICGDTGGIANSGCDTYKLVRMSKAQAKSMPHCRKHKPRSGERG